LAIVDLKGLPNPDDVLNDLQVLTKPRRVLVLTAIGTVQPEEIERLGFRTLSRPIMIRDVVDSAAEAMRLGHSGEATPAALSR
jgi:hypothetical protein